MGKHKPDPSVTVEAIIIVKATDERGHIWRHTQVTPPISGGNVTAASADAFTEALRKAPVEANRDYFAEDEEQDSRKG